MLVKRLLVTRAAGRLGEAAGLVLLFLVPTVAGAQSGGAYRISSSAMVSGGGGAAGGLLSLLASAGLPAAGQVTGGAYALSAGFWVPQSSGPTGIADPASAPLPLAIHSAEPNPTTGPSTIVYDLPAVQRVALSIYNVHGRLVRTLDSKPSLPGRHSMAWDGKDEAGLTVPAGLYFVRLGTDLGNRTEKLVVLR
jgi:hypothetical protein